MSVRASLERALEKGWKTQVEAWGVAIELRRPQSRQEERTMAVWGSSRETSDLEAGGLSLEHDATMQVRRDAVVYPPQGTLVTRLDSNRLYEVREVVRTTNPLVWRVGLRAA